MARSRIFSERCPHASANRSGASVATPMRPVSSSWSCADRRSSRATGMRSIVSIWRRSIANGGGAYLTRRFFSLLSERLGDAVVLMMAAHKGAASRRRTQSRRIGYVVRPQLGVVAASGRSCISSSATTAPSSLPLRTDSNTSKPARRGEHKIQRGAILPRPTYSAHWIAHRGLRRAIADFLDEERPAICARMAELAELSPFRKDGEA